jgi:hypothetical protein
MLGTLTLYPTAPQARSKPVQFDEDDDEEVVLKKLAARKKKKQPPTPAPLVYNLRQTPEGTLVSSTHSSWDFLVTRGDVDGYDSPVDRLFGTAVTTRVVLAVHSVKYESAASSCDIPNLLRVFGMLRPRENTGASVT